MPAVGGGAKVGKAKKGKKPTKKQLKKLEEARLLEELSQRLAVMKSDYRSRCAFYITEPKDQVNRQIDRAVAAKEGLKKLVLSKLRVTQNDVRALADTMKGNPDVLSMHFWHVKMDVTAVTIFCEFFLTLPSLGTLELVDSDITDDAAGRLARFLASSTTLQAVILDHNPLTAAGMSALFRGLTANPRTKLASFSARYCDAGPECGETIGLALKWNSSLTSVDLSHNQLGDLGLVSIAYSLLTNRALKSLALANNTIVDAPPVLPAVAPAAAAPFQWTVPGSLLVEVPPFAEPGPSADPTAVPSQSQSPPPPQPPPDESRKEGRPGAPGIVSYTMECDGDHAEVPGGAGALAGPPAAPATPGTAPPPRKQQQQQQQALPPPKPLDGSPLELLAQAIADNTVIYLVDLRGNHFGVRGAQAVLPAVKARGKTLAVWVSERIPNEIFTAIQDGNRKVFETAKKGNKGKKKGKGKGK